MPDFWMRVDTAAGPIAQIIHPSAECRPKLRVDTRLRRLGIEIDIQH